MSRKRPRLVSTGQERILIIRYGGLRGFVQTLGAFAAIRSHHPGAHVTLMTGEDTAAFAALSPWFDRIWKAPLPSYLAVRSWLNLRNALRSNNFSRIYDLETSRKTAVCFSLMRRRADRRAGKAPFEWNGTVRGCSHPHETPHRTAMHVQDRHADQLKVADVSFVPAPDLSWIAQRLEVPSLPFALTTPYVLLCPETGQPGRVGDWPPGALADLAGQVVAKGLLPVIAAERPIDAYMAPVQALCPEAVNISGRLSLPHLTVVVWNARAVIGPDNGVVHLAAASGVRTVVLYGESGDPALDGPRGAQTAILRRPTLAAPESADILELAGLNV